MIQERIYVVEDEGVVSLDIRTILEVFGYVIAGHADNAEDAIQQIEQTRPDLILMDIHLKGEMNGIQAAHIIRERYQIPVIFLTAYATHDTVRRASLTEPYGYIVKPFEERELNSAITIALYKHKVEQNVKNLQRRYRAIAEDMPVLVCRFLPDGELTFVNQQYCNYFQKTEQQLVGSNFFQFIPEKDRSWVSLHYEALTPENPVVTYEHQVQTPDGSLRWQRWTDRAIFNDLGVLVEFQSVGEDITEQRYANEALRKSEAKFRNVVHQSQDGIALTDENGFLIEWNAAMQALTGISGSQAIGSPIWEIQLRFEDPDLRTPEYLRNLEASTKTALQTGEAPWLGVLIERQYTHPDGTKRELQGIFFPVKTQIGFMLGSIQREVTNLRRLEDQIRLQGAALQATANAIFITDNSGMVVWANPAFTRLTGYSIDEVIGKNPRILKSGYHSETFYQQLWSVILSGQPWHGELINRNKNGQMYFEEMTITPVFKNPAQRDHPPIITHFIAVKQDISDRKRSELALARRLEFEKVVADISGAFVKVQEMDQSIDYALNRIGKLKNASRTAIFIFDYENLTVSMTHEWRLPGLEDISEQFQKMKLGDLAWFRSHLSDGKVITIEDIQKASNELGDYVEILKNFNIQAALIIPLIIQDTLAGMIAIASASPTTWNQDDIALFQTISGLIANAYQRAHAQEAERQARLEVSRLYQEAIQLSITDPLTGLYNRRYFYDTARKELSRLERYHTPFCIILFDIDFFKSVNDRYGHFVGDIVLRKISQQIKDSLRTVDTIARFGGEEFILLLPQTCLEEGTQIAERIREEIANLKIKANEVEVQITISLGVTCAAYENYGASVPQLETLLNQADKALYIAKSGGRNMVST